MGKKTTIVCDAAECKAEFVGEAVPVPPGWVRRTVVDTIGPAQSGEGEFSGQQQLLYCPEHAEALTAPALAVEVVGELARRDVAREGPAKDG